MNVNAGQCTSTNQGKGMLCLGVQPERDIMDIYY